jgi:antitoxin component YwqK of YwqJK toxin-antitoxin module
MTEETIETDIINVHGFNRKTIITYKNELLFSELEQVQLFADWVDIGLTEYYESGIPRMYLEYKNGHIVRCTKYLDNCTDDTYHVHYKIVNGISVIHEKRYQSTTSEFIGSATYFENGELCNEYIHKASNT